jgi:hypothetical protein
VACAADSMSSGVLAGTLDWNPEPLPLLLPPQPAANIIPMTAVLRVAPGRIRSSSLDL